MLATSDLRLAPSAIWQIRANAIDDLMKAVSRQDQYVARHSLESKNDALKPSLTIVVLKVSDTAHATPLNLLRVTTPTRRVFIPCTPQFIAMPDGVKPLLESNGSQTRFNMGTNMENSKRKKVLVVGAGAAGKVGSYSRIRS